MAELGRATITLSSDTTSIERTCRIIAQHFSALAEALHEDRDLSATHPFGGDRTPEAAARLQSIRDQHRAEPEVAV